MIPPGAPGPAGHGRDSRRNFPYTPELIAKGQARAKAAVDKIRARGGDVVFVRPPSAPQLRVNEEAQVPKGERLGRPAAQHAKRRHPYRRPPGRAGPDAARMVASQPQMRDRVHRRLCPPADRAHTAIPLAHGRTAAAWPLLLCASFVKKRPNSLDVGPDAKVTAIAKSQMGRKRTLPSKLAASLL